MPRPNSSGPRRSGGKRQGARSGDRTRENRSDSSGPRRSPKKTSRPDSDQGRGSRGDSKGFGRPKSASKGERDTPPKRSYQKGSSFGKRAPRAEGEGDKPRKFGKPGFGSSDRPNRSFGKRPPRAEGKDQGGEQPRKFGRPKFGFSKPSFQKDKPFGKRPPRAEGEDQGGEQPRKFGRSRSDSAKPSFKTDDSFQKRSPRSKTGDGDTDKPRKFDRSKFDNDEPRRERSRSFGKNDHGHQAEGNRPFKKFDRGNVKRGGQSIRQEPEMPAQESGGPVRLNKFIANSGVCSRREADELITMGLISVNGKVVTTLGHKVNPGDEVRHENKVLRAEKPVYILMNKPKGFLTTTSDPEERSTVMHIVANVIKERIYPVGRLDRNTTGLLVLTNDGDLAEKLMHPSHNVKKIYRVELDRPLTRADAQKIIDGVQLEEGRAIVDDLAYVDEGKNVVGLEIHIGWNRVVRRIFESLEYQVVKLDRTMYAGLTKRDLPRGEWRFLTREEVVLLKHYK
ncbi:pseudouridine synthase [Chryseolinea sp. T2]|uniref:pseudouridine synthase n=1 Tax=Chryseolinea sp. T2 TaxID=3129255 RepID=UPI0030776720